MKTKRMICPQCDRLCANATGFAAHLRWHQRQQPAAAPAVKLAQPKLPADPIQESIDVAILETEDRIRSLRVELEQMEAKQAEVRHLEAMLTILADTKLRLAVAGQPEAARKAAV